jgi:POT family proton-dependent oligopeptide transporter
MWEVFALFGLRTILVYYLVERLHFAAGDAVEVYSFSIAAALLMGLVGGVVADRLLGLRRAVGIGALLMAAAQFMIIYPSLLYFALALSAIGNGLLKPSLVAQVSLLYERDDPRRDRGFTVYKVACNLGGIVAPIVCGWLSISLGYGWAFGACGIGMLISALSFAIGCKYLPAGQRRDQSVEAVHISGDPSTTGRVMALLALVWVSQVFFCASYNQIGGTVALWASQDLNRTVQLFGSSFAIPAAWFQSVNPVLILAFAPVVTAIWSREKHSSAASDVWKIAAGTIMLAVSFFVLAIAPVYGGHSPSWLWLIVALVPFTLGELYTDPIGQALFTRLAPRGLVSAFAAIWFVTQTVGYIAAGWTGTLWVQLHPAPFFGLMGVLALIGAAVAALAFPLSR